MIPALGTSLNFGHWCIRPLRRVPFGFPAPGCTTRPAGLLITIISSSSYSILNFIDSASFSMLSSNMTSIETNSPPVTKSLGRNTFPSTKIKPSIIQFFSLLRENSGKILAKTTSKRLPACSSGIIFSVL